MKTSLENYIEKYIFNVSNNYIGLLLNKCIYLNKNQPDYTIRLVS